MRSRKIRKQVKLPKIKYENTFGTENINLGRSNPFTKNEPKLTITFGGNKQKVAW